MFKDGIELDEPNSEVIVRYKTKTKHTLSAIGDILMNWLLVMIVSVRTLNKSSQYKVNHMN